MFAPKVVRILIVFCLTFAFASSAKSFIKGLIIGSLLGKKAGSFLHEKGEEKEPVVHREKEYVPMPVHKEYVPVPMHEEPKYIPVYIIKECKKGKSVKKSAPVFPAHFGIAEHGFGGYDDNQYETKYSGTLDGYESRDNRVTKGRSLRDDSRGQYEDNEDEEETNDNAVNISISTRKY